MRVQKALFSVLPQCEGTMDHVWNLMGGTCKESRIAYSMDSKNYKNFLELLLFKILKRVDLLYHFGGIDIISLLSRLEV